MWRRFQNNRIEKSFSTLKPLVSFIAQTDIFLIIKPFSNNFQKFFFAPFFALHGGEPPVKYDERNYWFTAEIDSTSDGKFPFSIWASLDVLLGIFFSSRKRTLKWIPWNDFAFSGLLSSLPLRWNDFKNTKLQIPFVSIPDKQRSILS